MGMACSPGWLCTGRSGHPPGVLPEASGSDEEGAASETRCACIRGAGSVDTTVCSTLPDPRMHDGWVRRADRESCAQAACAGSGINQGRCAAAAEVRFAERGKAGLPGRAVGVLGAFLEAADKA